MPTSADKGSPIEPVPRSPVREADQGRGRAGVLRRMRGAALPLAAIGVPVKRKRIALAVAGVADVVQLVFLPLFIEGAASPLQDALDIVTAVMLVLVLGFHWRLALAFGAELIPGADLFPTWLAVVASLPAAAASEGSDPR